jgi:hypothetical protein
MILERTAAACRSSGQLRSRSEQGRTHDDDEGEDGPAEEEVADGMLELCDVGPVRGDDTRPGTQDDSE